MLEDVLTQQNVSLYQIMVDSSGILSSYAVKSGVRDAKREPSGG